MISAPRLSACFFAGGEFEKRILANEKNNVKFNFLVPSDPYHAYYKLRVRAGAHAVFQNELDMPCVPAWLRVCCSRVC